MWHPVHGPLVGDEACHAHFVASLTHRTTDRFKTSRSIRSCAFSARSRFNSAASPTESPSVPSRATRSWATQFPQRARMDAQVTGDLGDGLTGLPDDADRALLELRIVLPARFWHDYSCIVHASTVLGDVQLSPSSGP